MENDSEDPYFPVYFGMDLDLKHHKARVGEDPLVNEPQLAVQHSLLAVITYVVNPFKMIKTVFLCKNDPTKKAII